MMKKRIIAVLLVSLLFGTLAPALAAPRVKKIILNKKRVTMITGQREKLRAVVTPKKYARKLKWKSENREIAVVSKKGVINAKKKGKVKIKAYIGKKKAVCRITVTDSQHDESELVPYEYDWKKITKTDPKFILPGDIPTQKPEDYQKALTIALDELNTLRGKEDKNLPVLSLAHNIHQNTVLTRAQDCMYFIDGTHMRPDGSERTTAGLTAATAEVCTIMNFIGSTKNLPKAGIHSFWNSVEHKKILMDKSFDKIAIGMCCLKNIKEDRYYFTLVMQPAGFASKYELSGNRKELLNRINKLRKDNSLDVLKNDYIGNYNFIAASSIYVGQKREKNYCVIKDGFVEYSLIPNINISDWYGREANIFAAMKEFKLTIDESNYKLFTRYVPNYGVYFDEKGVEKTSSAYTWNAAVADSNFETICSLLFEDTEFLSAISCANMTHIYIGSFYDHIVLGCFL